MIMHALFSLINQQITSRLFDKQITKKKKNTGTSKKETKSNYLSTSNLPKATFGSQGLLKQNRDKNMTQNTSKSEKITPN